MLPPAAGGLPLARVEKQQVHVGTVVQLIAPQLSQRHHRKVRRHQSPARIGNLRLAGAGLQLPVGDAQRLFQQHVGQSGQLQGGFGQVRQLQDVFQGNAQVFPALKARQHQGRIRIQRRGLKTSVLLQQVLLRFQTAQAFVTAEPEDQLRLSHESFAEKTAVTEQGQQGMQQSRLARQSIQYPRARLPRKPFQVVQGGIGIGHLRQGGREQVEDARRQARLEQIQVGPGAGRVGQLQAGVGIGETHLSEDESTPSRAQ